MAVGAASADREGSFSQGEPLGVSCPYCTAAMPPEDFVAWPLQPRLATSSCPGCGRSVTVPIQWLVPTQTMCSGGGGER